MKRIKKQMMAVFMLIAITMTLFTNVVPVIHANAGSKVNINIDHEYYFVSAAYPSQSINMYVNSISELANYKAVNLYKTDKTATQRFKFMFNGNGNYLIMPTGSKYTVNVVALKSGTNVIAYSNSSKNNEYFIIEDAGNGYCTLRMENKDSLYLTAVSNSKLSLATKQSGNKQLFKLVDYTVEKAVADASNAADAAVNQSPEIVNGTLKLKVPSIKQTDKRWKNKEFVAGASPKCTIGNYGCLMTSVTAVMSYYDNTVYRPDTYYKMKGSVLKFVQVLPKTGKYKSWSLKRRSANAGNMKNISGWVNGGKYSLATIKKQLMKGNPVIVGGKGSKGWHYVVVYGFKNNGKSAADYYIMDPSNQSKNLKQHISKYGRTMYYKK